MCSANSLTLVPRMLVGKSLSGEPEYFSYIALGPVTAGQDLQCFALLFWSELRTIATDAAFCSRSRQAELSSFFEDCAFKLREAAEHVAFISIPLLLSPCTAPASDHRAIPRR